MFELMSILSEFVLSSFLSLLTLIVPSILESVEFKISEVKLLEISGFSIFVTIVIKLLFWVPSQF